MTGMEGRNLAYHDLKQLRATASSGMRGELRSAFMENLEKSPVHESHKVIFAVVGQGGTGKTWLLRELRTQAERADVPTALTDSAEEHVVHVLRRFAAGLRLPTAFRDYLAKDEWYEAKIAELLSDTAAPDELAAALGRGAGRVGLALGRQVPVVGLALEAVDTGAAIEKAGEATKYLSEKFRKGEDLRLITEPVSVLTPLFLQGLRSLTQDLRSLALFFDEFERTSSYVEPWLLDVFHEAYGPVPASLVVTVAGQQALSSVAWTDDEPWIQRVTLDVFSESEARDYLHAHGVDNDNIVAEILRLSGRLPVLLAALAAQSPATEHDIGDVTGTAIEVFLKWIDDPEQREVAIAAALPRLLNEDSLAAAVTRPSAELHFTWLRKLPFVIERPTGWEYHDVVRRQLIRHKRKESPQDWIKLQHALHGHYEAQQEYLRGGPDRPTPIANPEWQRLEVEYVYHATCETPSKFERAALHAITLTASRPELAERVATAILEAGEDTDDRLVARWGRALLTVVRQPETAEEAEAAIEALTFMLDAEGLALDDEQRVILLRRRGIVRSDAGDPRGALVDFDGAIKLTPNPGFCIAIAPSRTCARNNRTLLSRTSSERLS